MDASFVSKAKAAWQPAPDWILALAERAGCRVLSVGFDPSGGVVDAQPLAPVLSPDEIALVGTFLAEVA